MTRRVQAAAGPVSHGLRIGLFNVKFSPNLGDGLLSHCLERELEAICPDAAVTVLDLAGREDFRLRGRFRSKTLAMLNAMPTRARRPLVEFVLGRMLRRRLRPRWREALRGLDAVVVGGGNLLGDADLNFPLKLDAALDEARRAGLPIAVYGVGASDNWSPRGEALFRRALTGPELVYASVREQRSVDIWRRRLEGAGVLPARLASDPGLLIALHGPAAERAQAEAPLVGIGLVHPALLHYHADEESPRGRRLAGWFDALAAACVARGWRVALFTNGSPEDEEFLDELAPRIVARHPPGAVVTAPRFVAPLELAGFIARLDLLLAHRLHANITAYSYGIPHVGFSWDSKLASFFQQVGRGRYVCTPERQHPAEVVSLAAAALAEGIDPQRRAEVTAAARAHVADLAAALQRAVRAAPEAPRTEPRHKATAG